MTDDVRSTQNPISPGLVLATAAWGLAVSAASASGVLGSLVENAMPAYAALVAAGIAIPTLLYFAFPTVRRAVDTVGLRRLTLFHVWRIPAGLLFLWYAYTGGLPLAFALIAGVGDVVAGLAAATLFRREATVERLRRIHIFGATDFVAAVGTGLFFTLLGDPLMATLTTLPMALIPLFGVGLSGASHIVALNALRSERPLAAAAKGNPALLTALAAVWGAAAIAVSAVGLTADIARVSAPAYGLVIAATIATPIGLYFAWTKLRDALDAISIRAFTFFQVPRILGGMVFLAYGWNGDLPPIFAALVGFGDILAGVAAALALRADATPAMLKRAHIFGLVDFAIGLAVGMGLGLAGDTRLVPIAELPLSQIVLWWVGMLATAHVAALVRLARR